MSAVSCLRLLLALVLVAGAGSAALLQPATTVSTGDEAVLGAIFPRLSPSGRQIVVSYQGSLWKLPAAGGPLTQLTEGEGFDIEPAWSPDESRIAFLNTPGFGRGILRLIRSEDGSLLTLPHQVHARGKLYFHPDGTRILGSFQTSDEGFEIGWFQLESGQLQGLAPVSEWRQAYALSHGGHWIAFATSQDIPGQQGGNQGPEMDLWRLPAQGGTPEQLLRFPARIYDLEWSAQDRSLYVVTDLGGSHYDLWEIPVEVPGPPRKLTYGQADEDAPSVSGDGRFLLYTDNRAGPTALILREAEQGGEQWLSVSGLHFRRPSGRLKIRVLDRESGEPLDARLAVQQAQGKFYAPRGALDRLLRRSCIFTLPRRPAWNFPPVPTSSKRPGDRNTGSPATPSKSTPARKPSSPWSWSAGSTCGNKAGIQEKATSTPTTGTATGTTPRKP